MKYPVSNSPNNLKTAVRESPIIALVNADIPFLYYLGGILDETNCQSDSLQPVLVVGFGKENGIEYALV